VSRTEKGCRAKTNINTAMLKDVWLMLSFLMDVLTILGDINKAFQEKTAVISSVLFEIKSAVRNLERLRYRYIYICSITKNVRSHVQAVLFFAT
jgi:phage-related protein